MGRSVLELQVFMIASLLVFALGFLVALLLALVVVPMVQRRAKRLAYREFEATIPRNAEEIRASADHLRAATVFEARRREIAAARLNERAAEDLAEAGRMTRDLAEVRERNRLLLQTLGEYKDDLEEVVSMLEEREKEIEKLSADLLTAERGIEERDHDIDDLRSRLERMEQRASERAERISELELRISELGEGSRESERTLRETSQQNQRLRDELAVLESRFGREKSRAEKLETRIERLSAALGTTAAASLAREERPDGQAFAGTREGAALPARDLETRAVGEADASTPELRRFEGLEGERLRNEVMQFAAEMIDEARDREGEEGPIRKALEGSDPQAPAADSLAGRVRSLRQRRQEEAAE